MHYVGEIINALNRLPFMPNWITKGAWKTDSYLLMTPFFIAKGIANLTVVPVLTTYNLFRTRREADAQYGNPVFKFSKKLSYIAKTPLLIG